MSYFLRDLATTRTYIHASAPSLFLQHHLIAALMCLFLPVPLDLFYLRCTLHLFSNFDNQSLLSGSPLLILLFLLFIGAPCTLLSSAARAFCLTHYLEICTNQKEELPPAASLLYNHTLFNILGRAKHTQIDLSVGDFSFKKAPSAFLLNIRHRHRMMILYYKNPVDASSFFYTGT